MRPGTVAAGWILGLALVAAVIRQAGCPGSVPWVEDWSQHMEQLIRTAELQVVGVEPIRNAPWPPMLLDARRLSFYTAGRIPGAMPMPTERRQERLAALLPALEPGEPIIVYCAGKTCDEGLVLGKQLRGAGFTNVAIYVGGYEDWRRRRLPIERDSSAKEVRK